MIPVQRRHGIEVVDVVTKRAHRMSQDELPAGRQREDYLASCGARYVAANVVEPGGAGVSRAVSRPCRERRSALHRAWPATATGPHGVEPCPSCFGTSEVTVLPATSPMVRGGSCAGAAPSGG
jgi:hypothetical protein